jgi:hypothetical protein
LHSKFACSSIYHGTLCRRKNAKKLNEEKRSEQNASRNLTCKRTFKLLFRLFHEVAVPFGLIIIQRIHFQTAAVFGTALSCLPATASRIGPYQPTSAQAREPLFSTVDILAYIGYF